MNDGAMCVLLIYWSGIDRQCRQAIVNRMRHIMVSVRIVYLNILCVFLFPLCNVKLHTFVICLWKMRTFSFCWVGGVQRPQVSPQLHFHRIIVPFSQQYCTVLSQHFNHHIGRILTILTVLTAEHQRPFSCQTHLYQLQIALITKLLVIPKVSLCSILNSCTIPMNNQGW